MKKTILLTVTVLMFGITIAKAQTLYPGGTFFPVGTPSGNYTHPNSVKHAKGFFITVFQDGTEFQQPCPPTLVFKESENTCDYPEGGIEQLQTGKYQGAREVTYTGGAKYSMSTELETSAYVLTAKINGGWEKQITHTHKISGIICCLSGTPLQTCSAFYANCF